MTLTDIGANLAHDSFDDDRDTVLERALAAGVETMIVTGSDLASSRAAIALAACYPARLYATAGLHPHHAADWSPAMAELMTNAGAAGDVVALGEMGLDFFRDRSPRRAQIEAFEAQLAIAAECSMPVFLHQREAHAEFASTLENVLNKLPAAVVHCFTDNEAALADYLALGCYIGVTGWVCDERRGKPVADLLHRIPDDRLMIETDCPYLLPQSLKPRPATRRNEPAFLPEVVRAVARARGQSVEHVAEITTRNARVFFNLAPACSE